MPVLYSQRGGRALRHLRELPVIFPPAIMFACIDAGALLATGRSHIKPQGAHPSIYCAGKISLDERVFAHR